MAQNIYIRDDTREKLERVTAHDHRSLVDEIDWLVSRRLEECGLAVEPQEAPAQTDGGP